MINRLRQNLSKLLRQRLRVHAELGRQRPQCAITAENLTQLPPA